MEKVLFILILILYSNNNFYKNIEKIEPMGYDYIVNKNYKLSNNYIPKDLQELDLKYSCKDKYLRKDAKIYFEIMAKDAKKEGLTILAVSAYRSYDYQEKLYSNYVNSLGHFRADIASARAGHSEHQTGLSVDIANKSLDYDNFENTKEFYWMIDNSYKYGFILRYPKAKYDITGFMYEPWHYRFVGIDTAKYLHDNNLTLEEYKNKIKN